MSESSESKGFSAGLKRLSKHSGIYALGTAINKATGFLLIPFVTAYIGTRTNYGVKEIAEVTLVISGHLLGVNLLHGMTRYYADYEEGKQRTTLISTCMLLLAATTGFAMLIGLAFGETFAELLFGSREYADAFRVVVAILFFQCLGQVGLRYLQIVEKSGTYVVLTLAKLLIEVGLKVYLMVALQMTYMGVILPVLIGEGLLGGGTLLVLLFRFRAAFSMEIARRLIRYSYPLVASGLCMFVLHQADRFFLRFFHGLDAVGVYGLSYKLGYMVNALVFDSFALIWFPFIFGIKDDERIKFMMRKVLSYFTFGVSFISLGVALFSREVVYVMASEEFFEAHRAIPLIVLGYVFWAIYQITSTTLYLRERTGVLSMLVLGAAVVNVILNAILVPSLSYDGAAWATVGTFLVLAVACWILSEREMKVAYEIWRVSLPIVVALGLYSLGYVIPDGSIAWNLGLKAALCAAFPLILLLGGYFTKEERFRGFRWIGRRLAEL